MNYQPLISIVIPTYNRALMLQDSIDSVLRQTYQHFELVIVDDGSTDDTLVQLSRINDPRLVVVAGLHGGASAARNLGVNSAKGELIAFLDSDDLFLPHKLQSVVDLFAKNQELVMVYSHWQQNNLMTNETLILQPTAEGDIRHDLLMCSLIVVPTVVMKKDVFIKAGGFTPSMKIAEDYDLWCRVSSFGEVGLIPEPLSIVRLHKDNTFMEATTSLKCRLQVVNHFFKGYNTNGLLSRRVYIAKALYDVNYLFLRQKRFVAWFFVMLSAMILDWKRNSSTCKYIFRRKLSEILLRFKTGF